MAWKWGGDTKSSRTLQSTDLRDAICQTGNKISMSILQREVGPSVQSGLAPNGRAYTQL